MYNIYIMRSSNLKIALVEGKKKENGEEANFVDIITDSHLQTIKDMNLQNRGLTNMKQYK